MFNSFNSQTSPTRATGAVSDRASFTKNNLIQQEFSELGQTSATRTELCDFLDKKAGKTFNRDIFDELFDQLPKAAGGRVLVNDFVRVYLHADDIIRKKIENCKFNRNNFKKQREECMKKAEDVRATESYTAYGTSQNSIVNVTVLEVRNVDSHLSSRHTLNLYVEISFGTKSQIVKTKSIAHKESHVYNEKFTFEACDPSEQLKITVREHGKTGDKGFKGEVIIPLNNLKDQNIHDAWVELLSRSGESMGGEIHLSLQWIYSKVKYFAMVAQKWYDNIKKEDDEIQEYETQLQALHEPFASLQPKDFTKISVDLPQSQPHLEASTHIPQGTIEMSVGFGDLEKQITTIMNKAALRIAREPHPSETFWKNLTTILCFGELVIAMLIMLERNSFIEIVLCMLMLLQIYFGVLNSLVSLRVLAFITLGSIVLFDFIWLFINLKHLMVQEEAHHANEGGIQTFVMFLSVINMAVKVALSGSCYMTYAKIMERDPSNPNLLLNDANSSNYLQ